MDGEQQSQQLSPSERVGALADSPEIFGYDLDGQPITTRLSPAPLDPANLPLLVWLRGDEPFCGEFILDADDVMAQLGIKRSRLTQISGRELRVGRMRMGRYIRPVYRQVDVDAYQQWTRATASHVKAASVLQEAAKDLSATTDTLAQDVQATQHLQRETLDTLGQFSETVAGELRSIQATFAAQMAQASQETLTQRLRHYEVLELMAEHKTAMTASLNSLGGRLDLFESVARLLPELQRRTLHELEVVQAQNKLLADKLTEFEEQNVVTPPRRSQSPTSRSTQRRLQNQGQVTESEQLAGPRVRLKISRRRSRVRLTNW